LFTFREAGRQVSPVTMSCFSWRTAAPPCLPLGIKDSLEEDVRHFALGAFCLGAFAFEAFGFWAFGFWMKGGFLMWEALEGKRTVEGELLKGNC
jgi:hypothetical protein